MPRDLLARVAAAAAAALTTLQLAPVRGHVVDTTAGSLAGPEVVALAWSSAAAGAAVASGAVGARPAAASRSSGHAVGPRDGWVWPLRPRPAVIRGFEPPPQPWAGGHRGVDLAGGRGQAVRAAGDGVVSFSGVVAGRGVVTVRHAGGWRTTYEPVDDRLVEGSVVAAGERLGRLAGGPANHCTPRVCLHWGAVTGAADYHDPLVLLGLAHPVLLPLPRD